MFQIIISSAAVAQADTFFFHLFFSASPEILLQKDVFWRAKITKGMIKILP